MYNGANTVSITSLRLILHNKYRDQIDGTDTFTQIIRDTSMFKPKNFPSLARSCNRCGAKAVILCNCFDAFQTSASGTKSPCGAVANDGG